MDYSFVKCGTYRTEGKGISILQIFKDNMLICDMNLKLRDTYPIIYGNGMFFQRASELVVLYTR